MGRHGDALLNYTTFIFRVVGRNIVLPPKFRVCARMETFMEVRKDSRLPVEVSKQWGLDINIIPVKSKVWSVGSDYIVKASENREDIERNIILMKELEKNNIPAAKPIKTADGKEYAACNGLYYLMMSQLSGVHITDIYQEDYANITAYTGRMIGRLHRALLKCEQGTAFHANDFSSEITGWVKNNLEENGFAFCSREDFEDTCRELSLRYDRLAKQLIHRDLHYGNFLFQERKFTGFIDFDLSKKDTKIFDICYFLVGLLVGHEDKKEDVSKWYEIIASFIKGYEEENVLLKIEKDSICCLMQSIELLFVAFFIKGGEQQLAQSSANLYHFLKRNEAEICRVIRKK
jgi:Ser/Thr protein kinase RdoA (MazF antagonist)